MLVCVLDGCGCLFQPCDPLVVRYEGNVQFLGNIAEDVIPSRWCRIDKVKVENRSRSFGPEYLYKGLCTCLQGEQRNVLS